MKNLVFYLSVLGFFYLAPLQAQDNPWGLLDAGGRGAFNIGSAEGFVSISFEDSLNKNVLQFDYKAPQGTFVGAWTKDYPPEISPANVNAVRIRVKVPQSEQLKQMSVTLEIKGSKLIQTLDLSLKSGWNSREEALDWRKIGSLTEVVFVVKPKGNDPVEGSLYFDLDFIKSKNLNKFRTPSVFNILGSAERGMFNIGPAEGTVGILFDEGLKKNVLKFDYSAPQGTMAGVWTKNYSAKVSSEAVNGVRVGVYASPTDSLNPTSLWLEIKGTKDIQSVPLSVKQGWSSWEENLDWEKIGELKEVVFVVNPKSSEKIVQGSLCFDLDFIKMQVPVPAKSKPKPESPIGRNVGWLFALAVMMALLRFLAGKVFRRPVQILENDNLEAPEVFNFNLMDAMSRGAFNIGPARGKIKRLFDDSLKKDIIKFDYKAPSGTTAGVWASQYPSEFDSDSVNAVKFRAKASKAEAAAQIYAALEIKGTRQIQTLPVRLESGWNSFEESIDWERIGELKEVVFIVKPLNHQQVSGSVYLDIDFITPAPFKRTPPPQSSRISEKSYDESSIFSKLKQDLTYAAAVALTGGAALSIYALGDTLTPDPWFSFLIVGLGGAGIAELLKFGLTRGHLTPLQVFQNIFVSGILAVSSSREPLLMAPASWPQVMMLNQLTAALIFLIYHGFNAFALHSSGKHLRAASGTLIAGTPYLFGWLLLLGNAELIPAFWGKVLVVFLFNEAIINGFSLVVKGRLVKSYAHWLNLLVSAGVILSPMIADFGSSATVAALPAGIRSLAVILTTMVSLGGLWAEVYLLTGLVLDATSKIAPSAETLGHHLKIGMKKGMAYSAIFMGIVTGLNMFLNSSLSQRIWNVSPVLIGVLFGGIIFPLIKTIIETFDGSMAFFPRLRYSYRNGTLYLRGAVAGFGMGYAITHQLFYQSVSDRLAVGCLVGLSASLGINILKDITNAWGGHGRIQSWKAYAVDALLGGFIGSAIGFYLDAPQTASLIDKFKQYNSAGLPLQNYTIYPLLSKWGRIDLGSVGGGVKLFFNETLAGVIGWSVAAWLFAINRAFMAAFFQKETGPIKFLFSKAGLEDLTRHMIFVLRWGLWMAPIINTGLHLMAQATWYNQDGAFRTLLATYHSLTLNPAEFQAWSLKLFIALLSYDFIRILIWIDHMGLRVATLVNLSFIGMDKLDERLARFIGGSTAQRIIPESVKRFATWAPLLIPFYIPRGADWDRAWSESQAIQSAAKGGSFLAWVQSISLYDLLLFFGLALLFLTAVFYCLGLLRRRFFKKQKQVFELGNRAYKVVLDESGASLSLALPQGYDISRRSYDTMDPGGRVLYIVDAAQEPKSSKRSWPILGNFPKQDFKESRVERADGGLGGDSITVRNTHRGIRTNLSVSLPDLDSPAEIWTVMIQNLTNEARQIKIVPYLEWVLDRTDADRGHTQYSRLFPEMAYMSPVNAILAWQKNTKSMGFLASELAPEGYLTSRVDFIGRARSIWAPRVLETLKFLSAGNAGFCPTFDPIGSLIIDVPLEPKASQTFRLLVGYAKNKESAFMMIENLLHPKPAKNVLLPETDQKSLRIGHGEILPGTPSPYSEFVNHGNSLLIHTPLTPRPYDHALSNAVGHYVTVTNRGLHTTSNGNSQQNRLTPDWPDTVTKELPGEAIYLYDLDNQEWYSPTHHPLNDIRAQNKSEFSVDGTAIFRMSRGDLSTELTVFVPPAETAGFYILTVKNNSDKSKRIRVAPYFQIVLAGQPEWAGPLILRQDKDLNALFFENPRNTFRPGPAFVSMSLAADHVETMRGKFFGSNRGPRNPFMVEKGESDLSHNSDPRPIAGFLGTLDIPAKAEKTISIIFGQTDNYKMAAELIQKYKDVPAVQASLEETKKWWLSFMGTLRVETNQPEFDQMQNWLKYQALSERIWARRGFYQTSGAYGFRDQLQDSVNLMWVDPALARKQIILHASQQFLEGDVVHWFHTLHDGRTAFSNRSHASDNPLWLAWAVSDYVKATGDESILEVLTPYLTSDTPFESLPKNHGGWGSIYLRSRQEDSVYRHCIKAIDLVLEKRMGVHGLPLIGTGDWNDGLDHIGSQGKGESVWLGFFLDYILKNMTVLIGKKEGNRRKEHYLNKIKLLEEALECTWREDRYLRAIHDDGTEIGVKNSGVWEIDALTAAWAVISGINFERGKTVFQTALQVLEKENVILLGWPALREDTVPYLGRSSHYPEGVRENGMYCHGVQWLVLAARLLAERSAKMGDEKKSAEYLEAAHRLWMKISPTSHVNSKEIELYGGQPNKQSADLLTTFDPGRMIWNGYTGAAGWMLREAMEGVIGARLENNAVVLPQDFKEPKGPLKVGRIFRDTSKSPLGS